jgi:spore coat protein A, manganese oxidase
MSLTRREMIKAGLLTGGVAALPVGRAIATLRDEPLDEMLESPPVPTFAVPLRIPPLARPVRSEGNTDYYEITQRVARVPIIPGLPLTEIWGYNGITPGPTFRHVGGRDAIVKQINRLPVDVSVHLHGGDNSPEDDGHPLDLIPPGGSKVYRYTEEESLSTIWYHDHAIHETGRNVYMGLAGHFFVSTEEERALPLPKGRFDVPLAIQDKFFLKDGSIDYPYKDPEEHEPFQQGVFGDVILVNGTPKPFFRVLRRKYRFRVLNGSNARIYSLALSNGDPLTVLASEHDFLQQAVQTDRLPIFPSERYQVVIDFSKYRVGSKIELRNLFEDVPGDPFDPDKTSQIMRFDVVDDASDPSSIPADLGPAPDFTGATGPVRKEWVFERNGGAWTINDKVFDEDRFDALPKFNVPTVWRFVNQSGGWYHPIHPHAEEFLILDRNGKRPRPWERAMKDVVGLGPNEVARILVTFHHFRGPYVMHCHNIEHEDHDMMTQFKIV